MRIVLGIISVIVLLLLISYGLLFYFSTSIKFGAYDGVNFGSLTLCRCQFKNETVDAIAREMLSPINRKVMVKEEIPKALKDKLEFGLNSYRTKRKEFDVWFALPYGEEKNTGGTFYYYRGEEFLGVWSWLGDPEDRMNEDLVL